MFLFILVIIFVVGLVFGSFISAITWRIPRGIKILDLKARSICPKCKKEIAWFDNIPLFPFLILGGRCRNCKRKISFRYPLIELSFGILSLVLYLRFGFNLEFVIYFILSIFLFSIFIIDLEHQTIPDNLIFLGIAVFVPFLLLVPGTYSLLLNLFAGFFSSSLLLLIHLFTKGRGMGLGDVKFAVLGGLIVGLRLSLIWLFLAFLTGAVIGIILILVKKAGLKSQIAFGPFLVLAIPAALVYGEKILFWLHFS